MDQSLIFSNIILEEFTDFERNWAMTNRNFDSADFGAIAALTVEQLLTAVREYPTEIVLGSLCEKLDRLRAEQVKALVGPRCPEICEYADKRRCRQSRTCIDQKNGAIAFGTSVQTDNSFPRINKGPPHIFEIDNSSSVRMVLA
jgi:hypothetical protein